MKRKNGFLTFVFACFPGAGQMYYGYMHRGLSMMLLFFLTSGLTSLLGPAMVLMPVIWLYSFFDTYDLIHRAEAGEPKADEWLFFGNDNPWRNRIPGAQKVIGWGLVILGAWLVLYNWICPSLSRLFDAIGFDGSYLVYNMLPSILVAALLIWGGLWLLRSTRHSGSGVNPTAQFDERAADIPVDAVTLSVPGEAEAATSKAKAGKKEKPAESAATLPQKNA